MSGLVILGWGNPSRGDDALAPRLCERLEAWLPSQAAPPTVFPEGDIAVVQDFQLQVEHAMDLVDRRLALFIDAQVGLATPYRFTRLSGGGAFGPSSHAISPAAVLDVYRRVHGGEPPAAYLLAVGGDAFELGAALSVRAQANLEVAWALLQRLCAVPAASAWDGWLTGPPA